MFYNDVFPNVISEWPLMMLLNKIKEQAITFNFFLLSKYIVMKFLQGPLLSFFRNMSLFLSFFHILSG